MDGTRSALIVASYDYADPGLRRLRAPASDAQALAGVLRDPGIGGFEVRTLLNAPAHEVSLAVEEFFADRRPDDLLVVHFSCHGVKDEDGELYFATSNTLLGRLGATAVAAEFVNRRMSRSRSRRVVLLLDCCYAGAFERGMTARAGAEMGIESQFGGRGRAVITASSSMEYAFEGDQLADARELAPSVFTSALVEGLETGEADRDRDGQVGLDELYDYVYDAVRATTPNQTPGKWTFGVEGELYIARRSRPVTTPALLPPELRQAIDSPLAGVRGGAVQELARVLSGTHAGMALAARLALEQLTDDDSRTVAAAAIAALGALAPVPPEPARPELALSGTVIDLGQLPQHGRSPEQRIRISNAGGGDLNARASTAASWLKLRQADDELVIAVDTSAAGEYEGTVRVDSEGGTATIHVHARVNPAPAPAPRETAATRPMPLPGTSAAAHPRQDPALAPGSPAAADAVPPGTETGPRLAKPTAGQAVSSRPAVAAGSSSGHEPSAGLPARRRRLAAGGAVAMAVVVYLVIALVTHAFPFATPDHAAANGPAFQQTHQGTATHQGTPTASPANTVAPLAKLLPRGIPASTCSHDNPADYNFKMPGAAQVLNCTNGNWSVLAFQMDSNAHYVTARQNFNNWSGFVLSSSEGPGCPPGGGDTEGVMPWSNKYFPKRDGQVLECWPYYSGGTPFPSYAWSFPTEHAFIWVTGRVGTSFSALGTWWTNNQTQAAPPSRAAS